MTTDTVKHETPKQKSSKMQALPQILAVTAKNLLLLAFGLTLGYPTILIPVVADPKELFKFDEEGISWIGSINLICVPVGCIISGSLSEKIGRRRAMQLINIPFVVAWLLFYFSNTDWHIFAALALTGLTGGSLEAPVLTYVAEVTQPHIRGILSSVSATMCYLGITVMFVFGMFINWRVIALIACGFHVVSFFSLFFVPESPYWLIKKGRYKQAKKSLAWLRGWASIPAIEEEYAEIYKDVKHEEGIAERTTCQTLKLYTKKNFIWPYLLVSFIYFLSHFCGIATLQAYAVVIFATLKTPINDLVATGILGIATIVGCIVNSTLIYWAGKRVLTFVSLIGMGVCYIIVGIYAHSWDINTLLLTADNATSNSTTKVQQEVPSDNVWVPLVLLIFFTFLAHVGIRMVPWIIVSEIFNSDTRSAAAGICSATTYIMNFVCNKTYFATVADITFPGTFWMYASISLVGCTIVYYTLPETEGKSLLEIGEHFAGGTKLGKRVYRRPKIKQNNLGSEGAANPGYVDDNGSTSNNSVVMYPKELMTYPIDEIIIPKEITKM